MLKEVVLIDDGSNSTEITHLLPLYLKHRLADQNVHLHVLPAQTGLIGARIAGAKAATGEMLVFLDSHCEATPGSKSTFVPTEFNPTNMFIVA